MRARTCRSRSRIVLLLALVWAAASPLLLGQALARPAAASGSLDAAFQRAAEEFDVPRDLLVAIAYAETHLDDHGGAPSIDNGYG
ncbi:MAG: hypothetical protein IRY97_08615, partial [Thermomicrobiaceae bacterium]|nr:hypothetical protein [Thermomicrobiaceae bacterium]